MTDKELIELIKNEPEQGLRAVINGFGGYVYTIAYSKLSGVCRREDIEEAVSDIFMSFYRFVKTTDKELTSVSPYLGVIAKRHSINLYKKHLSKTDTLYFEELSDTAADDPFDKSESRRLLTDAVMSLGEPDSEIFLRKYFLGQKSHEIANALNMKTNTVDKKISRGLARLRKTLTEQEEA